MNIDNETIRLAIHAYRAAAEKTEAELHAPSKEWPEGFHTSDDADIIAEAGMAAAARVILANNDSTTQSRISDSAKS